MSILKLVAFSLVLLSFSGLCTEAYMGYPQPKDLTAIHAILQAWNATPNIDTNLAGWGSTARPNPCWDGSWRGVICVRTPRAANTNDENMYIVGLTLTDASIVGTLPKEIGDLAYLTSLTLTGNPGLSGPIPAEISQLRSLDILNLSNNNFSGSIPANLLQAAYGLQELDLSGNQLTGQLPNLGPGRNWLLTMKVSQNQLSGPTPSFGADMGWTSLTTLDLSGNSLTGSPPDLTSIFTLQSLNLSNNQFDGPVVPSSILNVSSNLTVLDLSRNSFTGPLPNFSLFSQALQHLDLSLNAFDPGKVPAWLFGCRHLQTLALKASGLFGAFPYTLLGCLPQLQTLILDNNRFNGTLYIGNVSGLSNHYGSGHLQLLSMTYNDITNVEYSSSDIRDVATVVMLQNNSYCLHSTVQQTDGQRCYCTQTCFVQYDIPKSNDRSLIIIISSVISGTVLVLIIATGAWLFWWSKRQKRYLQLHYQQKFAEFEVQPTIFAYNELKTATRDFHPDTKLGQGSYGAVYKGKLKNGTEVAVKQLFIKTQKCVDEFLNEVVLITGVKHRNLVKLKGCCLRENQRLLVYEYVEKGDLAATLFEGKGLVLNWHARFNICLGVARGLLYLHEIAQPRIIHRDIKASNILLDNNLQAKIADFGLALLFPDDKSHITTMHIAGTRGYVAPEYATLGQLTEKADIFSFGVLLLEVVSGRRNIDPNLPPDQIYLLERAWRFYNEDNPMGLVDCKLHLDNDEMMEVQRVINVALLCLTSEGERRPSMARVVAILHGDVEPKVLENDIEAGRVNELYDRFLTAPGSGFGLAEMSEGSDMSLLLCRETSSGVRMSLKSSNLSCSNVELNVVSLGR